MSCHRKYLILLLILLPCFATSQPITLYLTFDDGPDSGSDALSRIVSEEKIPVNVFLIGNKVLQNDTSYRVFQAFGENPFIEIGNHSYSHAGEKFRLYYQHPAGVLSDFILNADTLRLAYKTGRLPGRNIWRIGNRSRHDLPDGKAAADSLVRNGYTIFGWDIEWNCPSFVGRSMQSADEIIIEIEGMVSGKRGFTPNHIVILFHDCMLGDETGQSELSLFIGKIKRDPRYRFAHLSEYPLTGLP